MRRLPSGMTSPSETVTSAFSGGSGRPVSSTDKFKALSVRNSSSPRRCTISRRSSSESPQRPQCDPNGRGSAKSPGRPLPPPLSGGWHSQSPVNHRRCAGGFIRQHITIGGQRPAGISGYFHKELSISITQPITLYAPRQSRKCSSNG